MTTDQFYTVFESPIGRMALTSDGSYLTGLYLKASSSYEDAQQGKQSDKPFRETIKQLNEYFNGKRSAFDLPLAPQGTPFQQRVWKALQTIEYGETVSYADIARKLRMPNAFRAVGNANGQNPICLIIPCHRVIASNGALGGYSSGLNVKTWLLSHEGATYRKAA